MLLVSHGDWVMSTVTIDLKGQLVCVLIFFTSVLIYKYFEKTEEERTYHVLLLVISLMFCYACDNILKSCKFFFYCCMMYLEVPWRSIYRIVFIISGHPLIMRHLFYNTEIYQPLGNTDVYCYTVNITTN